MYVFVREQRGESSVRAKQMMNGVSLVFHYRLVFYVGVNSNGGTAKRGEERRGEGGNGERTVPSVPSAVLHVSGHSLSSGVSSAYIRPTLTAH